MGWIFKRKPPPKSKMQIWGPVFIPILAIIILGLIGLVFNSVIDAQKALAAEVKKIEEKKVDNTTLKLMIEKQAATSQVQQQRTDEKFEQQQKSIEKTLDYMQQQQTAKPSIPGNFNFGASKSSRLSPKEFKQYMTLTPEQKRAFKKTFPQYTHLPN